GLWFTSDYNGLYWYDGAQLHHFEHVPGDDTSLSSQRIRNLHQDSNGQLWIAASKGLHKFQPQSRSFSHFKPTNNAEFDPIDDDIFTIQSTGTGKLWLGGVVNGIFTFTIDNPTFEKVSGKADINGQFKPTRVNVTYKDSNGTLWFGLGQGITALPQTAQRIDYLTDEQGGLRIYDIEQLDQNTLGFVSNLQYYQLTLNDFSAQQVTEIKRPYRFKTTTEGDQWFATVGNHAQRYNRLSRKVSQFDSNSFIGDKRFPAGFFDLFVDDDGYLWFLPLADLPRIKGGVVRLDPNNNHFNVVADKPILNTQVRLDEQNRLLVSTDKGFFKLNTKTMTLSPWSHNIKNEPKRVLSLFMDSQKTLWIGTEGMGLAKLTPGAKHFEYYTMDNGLLSNAIASIVEDNHNRLWLGTSVGLIRFDKKTDKVQNFEHQDGLLFARFYKNSARLLLDGRIVMGTYGGLMLFDPQTLTVKHSDTKVLINQFKLLNQPVEIRAKSPSSPLLKPISFSNQLQLSYLDYGFSFGFSAMELLRPDQVEYAYKMEGLDTQWLYTDAQNRSASYTTLAASNYLFKVKARKGSGPWSETTTLQLTITPPWWRTNWAMFCYLLSLLALIYAFIRYRTNKLLKHAQELEHRVTLRTAQLQASKDELAEKSQTVTDLLTQKQRLFASISHEFRTPLTLILSPVDSLLRRYIGQPLNKELQPVMRNAQRLLRMVDQLLEFAKLEQKLEQKTETVSLRQTLLIICESFDKLVTAKQLTLEVKPFIDVNLTVLHDSLNKILLNLLSNAVKYTPAQGAIVIDVTLVDAQIAIAVKDTGIGIDKVDHQQIFERFNRASQHNDKIISGTGIGLALVKELVEANDGQIELHSAPGQGSTFIIHLPSSVQNHNEDAQIQPESLALEIQSVSYGDASMAVESVPTPPEQPNHKSILIVDDNSDIRTLLQNELQQQYQCLLAANGKEGLALAVKHLPDLVLSDVMMPLMDGYELAEKLKEHAMTSHIPLILLTAKGSAHSRIKGLRLLIDDYLTKPFNVEELRQRIHNTLTIRDSLSKRFASHIEHSPALPQLQPLGMSDVDQAFIDQVYEQLAKYHKEVDFNVKLQHKNMAISEKQLYRKLKALLNLGASELLRNYRLTKAVELLKKGNRISAIYYEVGFSSHSYFSACFKSKYGQSPSTYLQQRDEEIDSIVKPQ
ncbi:MAG: response regulator, partial [Psychrosphaera sp.]|nr:response regulator [Psychrosphaera sp.]